MQGRVRHLQTAPCLQQPRHGHVPVRVRWSTSCSSEGFQPAGAGRCAPRDCDYSLQGHHSTPAHAIPSGISLTSNSVLGRWQSRGGCRLSPRHAPHPPCPSAPCVCNLSRALGQASPGKRGVAPRQSRRGAAPRGPRCRRVAGLQDGCRQQGRVQAAPAAALSGAASPVPGTEMARCGGDAAPQVPTSEMLTAGVAVRMRPRWGLEGEGMFVFAEGGRCESASPAPTHGAGMAGSPKWLSVPWISGSPFSNPSARQGCWPRLPAPKDTGFSTGLTRGSLKNPCAKDLAPGSPRRHPCRSLFNEVLAAPA